MDILHFEGFVFGKKAFYTISGKSSKSGRCLKSMENNNLIEKKINNHETEYFLTSKGMKLNKVLYELIIFALDTHEGDFYTNEEIIFIKEKYIHILNL